MILLIQVVLVNLVVLFNLVDLVILVILDIPAICWKRADLVSSHFWDFCF